MAKEPGFLITVGRRENPAVKVGKVGIAQLLQRVSDADIYPSATLAGYRISYFWSLYSFSSIHRVRRRLAPPDQTGESSKSGRRNISGIQIFKCKVKRFQHFKNSIWYVPSHCWHGRQRCIKKISLTFKYISI